MPVDETQAIPFALGQKLDWVHPLLEARRVQVTQ